MVKKLNTQFKEKNCPGEAMENCIINHGGWSAQDCDFRIHLSCSKLTLLTNMIAWSLAAFSNLLPCASIYHSYSCAVRQICSLGYYFHQQQTLKWAKILHGVLHWPDWALSLGLQRLLSVFLFLKIKNLNQPINQKYQTNQTRKLPTQNKMLGFCVRCFPWINHVPFQWDSIWKQASSLVGWIILWVACSFG